MRQVDGMSKSEGHISFFHYFLTLACLVVLGCLALSFGCLGAEYVEQVQVCVHGGRGHLTSLYFSEFHFC